MKDADVIEMTPAEKQRVEEKSEMSAKERETAANKEKLDMVEMIKEVELEVLAELTREVAEEAVAQFAKGAVKYFELPDDIETVRIGSKCASAINLFERVVGLINVRCEGKIPETADESHSDDIDLIWESSLKSAHGDSIFVLILICCLEYYFHTQNIILWLQILMQCNRLFCDSICLL